ncbi:MAG TPA: ADP-dependent glucokinase/phosphofructokinase, partial [Methanothrix sp.]|nr:ADP-dependent glucokinase/phosphofructokinase [Methanothrix sp.]
SPALASRIEKAFAWQMRLGGNAGIMANVLADLGARPILNAPALGPRLAGLLSPDVRVPLSGSLAKPGRVAQAKKDDRPEPVHFVFQFKRGEEIRYGRDKFIVPQDNRFIASYDPVNTALASSRDFDSYCLEHISAFSGAMISGFHLLPLQNYEEILPEKINQLRSWKKRNPNLFIHLELGSFQSPQIMSHLMHLVSEVPIDSLGMNEDELDAAAGLFNLSIKANLPASWQERVLAAELLQDKTGIFRVSVHTRDYILSVIRDGHFPAQDEILALQSGVDSAASLAACGSMRAAPSEEFNEKGLAAAADLRRLGATSQGTGAALQSGGRIVSLVPARQVSQPKITVGLGDTATASIFFCELEAIRRNAALS